MQLTGTVSHMFGQATLDSSYQEEREQILESCQSSSDHFKAGLMGLSSGVFGGVTSIMSQPYKGAQEYGFGVSHYTQSSPKGTRGVGSMAISFIKVLSDVVNGICLISVNYILVNQFKIYN